MTSSVAGVAGRGELHRDALDAVADGLDDPGALVAEHVGA